jgi:hypothetical protein
MQRVDVPRLVCREAEGGALRINRFTLARAAHVVLSDSLADVGQLAAATVESHMVFLVRANGFLFPARARMRASGVASVDVPSFPGGRVQLIVMGASTGGAVELRAYREHSEILTPDAIPVRLLFDARGGRTGFMFNVPAPSSCVCLTVEQQ